MFFCNQLQNDIDYCKTCLRLASTTDEREKYIYELDELQSLLNGIILSLRK